MFVVLCASFLHFYNTCLVFVGAGAAAWATCAAAWATGAAVWGIGVAASGAANKGGVTTRRGVGTNSFRLIRMFSSPRVRLALSYSCRPLFANLSFLVRSGPI